MFNFVAMEHNKNIKYHDFKSKQPMDKPLIINDPLRNLLRMTPTYRHMYTVPPIIMPETTVSRVIQPPKKKTWRDKFNSWVMKRFNKRPLSMYVVSYCIGMYIGTGIAQLLCLLLWSGDSQTYLVNTLFTIQIIMLCIGGLTISLDTIFQWVKWKRKQ